MLHVIFYTLCWIKKNLVTYCSFMCDFINYQIAEYTASALLALMFSAWVMHWSYALVVRDAKIALLLNKLYKKIMSIFSA